MTEPTFAATRSGLRRLAASSHGDLLVAQAAQMLATAIVSFGTAALLGPSERGKASFLLLVANLGAGIALMSLQIGVVHARNAGDLSAPWRGFRLAGFAGSALGAAGAVALWSGTHPHIVTAGQFALSIALSGAGVISLYLQRWVQISGNHREYRSAMVVQNGVYLIVAVGFVIVKPMAASLLLAWGFGVVCSLAWCGLKLASSMRESRLALPRATRLRVLSPSLGAHTAVWSHQVLYRADLLLLGLRSDAGSLGVYAMATATAEVVWAVAEAISLGTLSAVAMSEGTATERIRRNVRSYLLLACPVGVIVLLVGTAVFLGPLHEFRGSIPLMLILMPGVVVGGIARLYLNALLGQGRQSVAAARGAASVAMVLLYIPAISAFGAAGAAWVSTSTYIVQAYLLWRACESRT